MKVILVRGRSLLSASSAAQYFSTCFPIDTDEHSTLIIKSAGCSNQNHFREIKVVNPLGHPAPYQYYCKEQLNLFMVESESNLNSWNCAALKSLEL